jgi:hypothetical protein
MGSSTSEITSRTLCDTRRGRNPDQAGGRARRPPLYSCSNSAWRAGCGRRRPVDILVSALPIPVLCAILRMWTAWLAPETSTLWLLVRVAYRAVARTLEEILKHLGPRKEGLCQRCGSLPVLLAASAVRSQKRRLTQEIACWAADR